MYIMLVFMSRNAYLSEAVITDGTLPNDIYVDRRNMLNVFINSLIDARILQHPIKYFSGELRWINGSDWNFPESMLLALRTRAKILRAVSAWSHILKNITFTICPIVIGAIEMIRKKIIETKRKKNVINVKCRFPTMISRGTITLQNW